MQFSAAFAISARDNLLLLLFSAQLTRIVFLCGLCVLCERQAVGVVNGQPLCNFLHSLCLLLPFYLKQHLMRAIMNDNIILKNNDL